MKNKTDSELAATSGAEAVRMRKRVGPCANNTPFASTPNFCSGQFGLLPRANKRKEAGKRAASPGQKREFPRAKPAYSVDFEDSSPLPTRKQEHETANRPGRIAGWSVIEGHSKVFKRKQITSKCIKEQR